MVRSLIAMGQAYQKDFGFLFAPVWHLNECISLTVLSVAQVQFPAVLEHFKGFFPG